MAFQWQDWVMTHEPDPADSAQQGKRLTTTAAERITGASLVVWEGDQIPQRLRMLVDTIRFIASEAQERYALNAIASEIEDLVEELERFHPQTTQIREANYGT